MVGRDEPIRRRGLRPLRVEDFVPAQRQVALYDPGGSSADASDGKLGAEPVDVAHHLGDLFARGNGIGIALQQAIAGKGIRRDIHDAHDERGPREEKFKLAGAEDHGK